MSNAVNARGAAAIHVAQGRRLGRAGIAIVLGALVPVGLWMSLAELSMAVVAPAFVKVDLNRRPVQHLEGGIVRAVLVRDGQRVKAGEPVLMLGDVGVDADRNRLAYRAMVERAGIARLDSEQVRGRRVLFPADVTEAAQRDERIRDALKKEEALFDARRDSLESEVALMKSQRQRIDDETVALRAQIEQVANSLDLQRRDLEVNRACCARTSSRRRRSRSWRPRSPTMRPSWRSGAPNWRGWGSGAATSTCASSRCRMPTCRTPATR